MANNVKHVVQVYQQTRARRLSVRPSQGEGTIRRTDGK